MEYAFFKDMTWNMVSSPSRDLSREGLDIPSEVTWNMENDTPHRIQI